MSWLLLLALSDPLDFKPSVDTVDKVKDSLSKQQAGDTAKKMHLFRDTWRREKEIREPML